MIYLYYKAFHLISVICWMVGLLYLPRLFVYHSEVSKNSISYKIFLLMEKRLIRFIMLPAMLFSLLFGVLMVHENYELIYEQYFIIKIILILLLFAFHGFLIKLFKSFERENNQRTSNYFRAINEIPTVLMIIIIILVVVKPNIL